MSIQAVAWVLKCETTTKGAERLVLISLANYANDDAQCWPSAATIAQETNLSVDHVRRSLAKLEAAGLISRDVNAAPDERIPVDRRPNLYTLDGYAQKSHPSDERVRDPRGDGYANGAGAGTRNARQRVRADRVPKEKEESKEDPKEESTGSLSLVGDTPALDLDLPGDDTASAVESLCEILADAVLAHRGGEGRPTISARWRTDMRLLVERGPLRISDAKPVSPERVRGAIEFVFSELAEPEGRTRFCWADQIRSPGALRDHWAQLLEAGRKKHAGRVSPGVAAINRAARRRAEANGETYVPTTMEEDLSVVFGKTNKGDKGMIEVNSGTR